MTAEKVRKERIQKEAEEAATAAARKAAEQGTKLAALEKQAAAAADEVVEQSAEVAALRVQVAEMQALAALSLYVALVVRAPNRGDFYAHLFRLRQPVPVPVQAKEQRAKEREELKQEVKLEIKAEQVNSAPVSGPPTLRTPFAGPLCPPPLRAPILPHSPTLCTPSARSTPFPTSHVHVRNLSPHHLRPPQEQAARGWRFSL